MGRTKLLSLMLWLFISPALAQPFQPPFDAPTTNASVVITTGNTFQTVLSAVANPAINSTARHSLTIANNNTTDSCWVYIGSGTATKGTSILLIAGASYTRYWPFIPSDVIQATCTSTSDTLYVDTQ
jgi:hypothetical protein